ncbi:uncharacterized protein LTHEOB_863 [Lasiodiplodia theobromae]|uniref:uncharacterized protein n=1 Tax=Lasiodiplodia theobromae TaxID=45133 RepID=UPI0015C3A938|nr:uncharacterized protein LTHEOB_863 [Lasiodiplodia theobromae]KAF4540921.1 hypothetical protein LTHEOB_863 [Lasiodiplodia theobromae]
MPPTEALVSGEGWISDESSFYGDDETVNTLEKRSDLFNVSEYWSTHENRLATVAYKARAAKRPPSTLKGTEEDGSATASGESGELAYPNEGDPLWYQPSETVSEFLKRCPPDTTVLEESGIPWFWVDNPYQSAHSKQDPDYQALMESGSRLLEDYRKKREDLEKKNPSMRKGAITSKLIKDRQKLKQQIAELARETHVVCGKWLIFPTWDDIPRLWKQVCLAVLANRLGPTAKVSTKSINKKDAYGVIIIYTRDCFDVSDVRRVLLALVDIGLASDRDDAPKIWYKMDAYTHLQLDSGNEYNLPASLYSSTDLLKSEGSAAKRKVEELHSPQSKSKGKQKSITDMFR